MKLEELRVGNWVKIHIGYSKVLEVLSDCINTKDLEGVFDFEPIPLTEEILLKCGFEDLGDLLLINIQGGEISYEYGCIYLGMGHYYQESNQLEIKNLHQLQNLYYSLTGKEINIEL